MAVAGKRHRNGGHAIRVGWYSGNGSRRASGMALRGVGGGGGGGAGSRVAGTEAEEKIGHAHESG